ncbi:MAG: hypothetical protein QOJ63_3146, partial [Solirubrobacteraceae bacterium]|nr:hypothetical protein [Solirubrobacteraceae bacterium]
ANEPESRSVGRSGSPAVPRAWTRTVFPVRFADAQQPRRGSPPVNGADSRVVAPIDKSKLSTRECRRVYQPPAARGESPDGRAAGQPGSGSGCWRQGLRHRIADDDALTIVRVTAFTRGCCPRPPSAARDTPGWMRTSDLRIRRCSMGCGSSRSPGLFCSMRSGWFCRFGDAVGDTIGLGPPRDRGSTTAGPATGCWHRRRGAVCASWNSHGNAHTVPVHRPSRRVAFGTWLSRRLTLRPIRSRCSIGSHGMASCNCRRAVWRSFWPLAGDRPDP